VPSKSIDFPCPEYTFMAIPIESFFSELPEFFARIQEMVSSVSSFTCHLEFISEPNLLLAELDVCHSSHSHISHSPVIRSYV